MCFSDWCTSSSTLWALTPLKQVMDINLFVFIFFCLMWHFCLMWGFVLPMPSTVPRRCDYQVKKKKIVIKPFKINVSVVNAAQFWLQHKWLQWILLCIIADFICAVHLHTVSPPVWWHHLHCSFKTFFFFLKFSRQLSKTALKMKVDIFHIL